MRRLSRASLCGSQSWLQAAFQAARRAGKPACRQDCLPHHGFSSAFVVFLVLTAALYSQTAPDPSEVLDGAREKIQATMKHLPKYACLQTVDRTYYALSVPYVGQTSCDQISADKKKGRKRLHVDATDRLRFEVAQGMDNEIHALPQAGRFDFTRFDLTEIDQMVDSGPFATGAFGGYLEDIFENDASLYDYRGPKTNDGKQVFVYGYQVAESVSHYEVHAQDSWVITGYSGTFEVDPQTLDIERLTIETSELPAETQLCLADAALDYQRVQIGEGTFLLPRQSQLHLILRNGQETNNIVVFSACREFRTESAVRFESPEGKPVGTLEAPVVPGKPRPPWPSGLAVDLRLTTAIDTDTSAAGDPVTATVVNAVHAVRSLDTLIPAGALVHGRISRIEHHFSPMEYLSIGLSFQSVVFDGALSPFAVRTELPPHFTGTVPIDLLRGLASRMPTPPPDTIVFPHENHHAMPAGTVTHWITWTRP